MGTTFCSYYNQSICRSCEWLEQTYDEQIACKETVLLTALKNAAPLVPISQLEATVRSSRQGFRNRAKMAVTGTLDTPIVGLTGDLSNGLELDQGRELLSCPIHHPKLNELLEALPAWIRDFRLTPYRIGDRAGELKGVIAFYSPLSQQGYVRFVVRSRECLDRLRTLVPELQSRFPWIMCISANIQSVPHAVLEGPEEIILTAKTSIEHLMGAVTLKLAPQAFVQTNVEVATQLYQTAARWIAEAKPNRALELFCGQGAFSFFAARSARELRGIEINADAVQAANETVRALGLTHLSFIAADATRVGGEIAAFGPDLILANPPRKGLGAGVTLIEEHKPPHFIYSSCNVETLATDIARLSSLYEVRHAQLFDMFPHTTHFETLVWLARKGST